MMQLAWQERPAGLAPAGVVSTGAATGALLDALARRSADELQDLTIAAADALVCVLGPARQLPWVDGVRYCAPAPDAPALWLPTTLAPTLPAELLHAALARRAGPGPLLLWADPALVLPLADAKPVTPALLAWLAAHIA